MDTCRKAENGWFDGPRLSRDEDRASLVEWFEHWEYLYSRARMAWYEHNELFKKVYDFHIGPFQQGRLARAALVNVGKFMYASNPDLSKIGRRKSLTVEEFAGLAWRRYVLGSERELELRDGSGFASLADVFVSEFVKVNQVEDPAVVRDLYEVMLANSIVGVVGEFVVIGLLASHVGESSVRRGSDADENIDVDCWFGLDAVSVKCGGAFRIGSFRKLREEQGKTVPVVYVGFPLGVNVLSGSLSDISVVRVLDDGSFSRAGGFEQLSRFGLKRSLPESLQVAALKNFKLSRRAVVDSGEAFGDEFAAAV